MVLSYYCKRAALILYYLGIPFLYTFTKSMTVGVSSLVSTFLGTKIKICEIAIHCLIVKHCDKERLQRLVS